MTLTTLKSGQQPEFSEAESPIGVFHSGRNFTKPVMPMRYQFFTLASESKSSGMCTFYASVVM